MKIKTIVRKGRSKFALIYQMIDVNGMIITERCFWESKVLVNILLIKWGMETIGFARIDVMRKMAAFRAKDHAQGLWADEEHHLLHLLHDELIEIEDSAPTGMKDGHQKAQK